MNRQNVTSQIFGESEKRIRDLGIGVLLATLYTLLLSYSYHIHTVIAKVLS